MATSLKIPSPWQTELAVPAYVRAEGLQSRAFITKWAPRGNYDDPDPYDPSWDKAWAQPGYVMAEGYGQGSFVTEWLPRGFYVGEVRRLCRRIKKHQRAASDSIRNGVFGAYGRRVAAHVLTSVKALPPAARKDAIRKVMKSLDPQLSEKTQRYAQQYVDAGFHPTHALELGMAKAVTAGIGTEVVEIGKKGRMQGGRCQTQLALGALPTLASAGTKIASTAATTDPQPGQCTQDGTMIWKLRADGSRYAWFPVGPNDKCTGTWGGNVSVTVHDSATASVVPPDLQLKMLQVGTFLLPLADKASTTLAWSTMTPAQQREITGGIAEAVARGFLAYSASAGGGFGNITQWRPLSSWVAGWPDTKVPPNLFSGDYPLMRFTHPDNGKKYGLFVVTTGTADNQQFRVSYRPYETTWEKVWGFLKDLVAKIVDFVGDVVTAVAGLACTVLSSQGALAAGAGAAAVEGAPPQTGANGVAIVQQACAGGGTPAPPAPDSGSWLLPAAIGGGILLAGILLTKKRK